MKLSIDKAYYFKTALPVIQKCYEAIAMCKPQEFSFSNPGKFFDKSDISLENEKKYQTAQGYYAFDFKRKTYQNLKKNGDGNKLNSAMFLVNSLSRSGDSVSGLIYEKPKNILKFAIGGWAESYLNFGKYR